MFTILDYSSALEYSIIRRYTNIVYYLLLLLFKVQYPMYIKIRVQWTDNDIYNNHSRYTL